jgi:hypothetical protein
MREVNGMREDNFFAEPIVESKGRKPAPADTTLTIQSQNGPINVPVSRTRRSRIFQFQLNCWQRIRWSLPINPKDLLTWHCKSESPPNQKKFRYSELVAGLKEANHLFRKALGILAILAPQTKDLTFVFASSGSGRPEVTVL